MRTRFRTWPRVLSWVDLHQLWSHRNLRDRRMVCAFYHRQSFTHWQARASGSFLPFVSDLVLSLRTRALVGARLVFRSWTERSLVMSAQGSSSFTRRQTQLRMHARDHRSADKRALAVISNLRSRYCRRARFRRRFRWRAVLSLPAPHVHAAPGGTYTARIRQ